MAKGLVRNADLLAFCRQLEDLDQEIARREQEIEQTRAGQEEPAASKAVLIEEPDTLEPEPSPASSSTVEADLGAAFLREEPAPESGNPPRDVRGEGGAASP